MELNSDIELANTREKLEWLESRYQTRLNETSEDAELHEMTLQSLKRLINQLKEEISRYECRQRQQLGSPERIESNGRRNSRELKSDIELANTREKLQQLEALYKDDENDLEDDEELRELSMRSIKRLINQLKEEIARYECRQPAQR